MKIYNKRLLIGGLKAKLNQPTLRGCYMLALSVLRDKSESITTTRCGLVHFCF